MAHIENYLLLPFLSMWAGRYLPTPEHPDDCSKKYSNRIPLDVSMVYYTYARI